MFAYNEEIWPEYSWFVRLPFDHSRISNQKNFARNVADTVASPGVAAVAQVEDNQIKIEITAAQILSREILQTLQEKSLDLVREQFNNSTQVFAYPVSFDTPFLSSSYLKLSDAANDYLSDAVKFIGYNSSLIEPEIKDKIRRKISLETTHNQAITYSNSSGQIHLVAIDCEISPVLLRNQAVKAAQIYADSTALSQTFASAARLGKQILEHKELYLNYRDITWIKAVSTESGLNQASLDFSISIHPIEETMNLARKAGIQLKSSAVGALFSYYLWEKNSNDYNNSFVKEVVALALQEKNHPVLNSLFESAHNSFFQRTPTELLTNEHLENQHRAIPAYG